MRPKKSAKRSSKMKSARSTHRAKPARRPRRTERAVRVHPERAAMDIDQKIRINELQEEINEVSGGKMRFSGASPECPPDIEEQFLQSVLEYEKAEQTTSKK